MPTKTYRWAITDAMREEMARDDRVFLMGEDVAAAGGAFGASRGLLDAFGPARSLRGRRPCLRACGPSCR